MQKKGTRWRVRPSKTLTRLRIRSVWSESSMAALLVAKGRLFRQVENKTLIRLHGCADRLQYSLYAYANVYNLCWTAAPITHSFDSSYTIESYNTDVVPQTVECYFCKIWNCGSHPYCKYM